MKQLPLILLTFLALSCSEKSGEIILYQSKNLKIEAVSEKVWVHTSYLDIPNYGKFPCNGMIYTSELEALVFDTPTDSLTSEELINWIKTSQNKTIKGIVINHFHNDCLGGLSAFHKHQIPSYALVKTIDLAESHHETLPQKNFTDSLILQIGNHTAQTFFLGSGHTKDNVVSYLPEEQILFGGCLIKAIGAGKGNLADADTLQWANTVKKIQQKLPHIKTVIPGHGAYGGLELLDYTIKMFEYQVD